MNQRNQPSRRKSVRHGIAVTLAALALTAGATGTAAATVTGAYGPYSTSTQCWIDVEAAHENGQTVTQGCQWRSYNGQWGYYFTAY